MPNQKAHAAPERATAATIPVSAPGVRRNAHVSDKAFTAQRGAGVQQLITRFGWMILCLVPGLWALLIRKPLPVDETRYLTVAWEMWTRGDFLVPHLAGQTYSHKPPLLFWLFQGGWQLFGVNEWWPRMIGPLCALVAAALTRQLAWLLWPASRETAALVPWILAGAVVWVMLGQMLMFDMLLTVCALTGIIGVWLAATRGRLWDFALIAVGIGLGLLAKGPIILVHVLLPAALAPLWQSELRRSAGRWYGRLLLALLGGVVIVGAWLLPAAIRGGSAYTSAILWHQTADRMAGSFAHARPWWFYVPLLPLMLLPWSAWPRLWRSVWTLPTDAGSRFVLVWLVAVFISLSLISGKQPHYALPIAAAAVLLIARAIASRADAANPPRDRPADHRVPGLALAVFALGGAVFFVKLAGPNVPYVESGMLWALGALVPAAWAATGHHPVMLPHRLAAATVLTTMLIATGFFQGHGAGYDLVAPARAVGALQRGGATVATIRPDHGQLGFLGRLATPLVEVRESAIADWGRTHGGDYLLVFRDRLPAGVVAERVGRFPYRSGWMTLWRLAGSTPPAEGGPV